MVERVTTKQGECLIRRMNWATIFFVAKHLRRFAVIASANLNSYQFFILKGDIHAHGHDNHGYDQRRVDEPRS